MPVYHPQVVPYMFLSNVCPLPTIDPDLKSPATFLQGTGRCPLYLSWTGDNVFQSPNLLSILLNKLDSAINNQCPNPKKSSLHCPHCKSTNCIKNEYKRKKIIHTLTGCCRHVGIMSCCCTIIRRQVQIRPSIISSSSRSPVMRRIPLD